MKVKDRVMMLLETKPKTRGDDNLLIVYFIKQEYGLRDTFEIAKKVNTNLYESVRRARQKVQETNPLLKPDDKISKARANKEKKVRRSVKGV